MTVWLEKISASDREHFDQLYRDYVCEMSYLVDQGYTYNPGDLDKYWQRDDHYPYFVAGATEQAGFILVRRYPGAPDVYDLEQFYIKPEARRQGVGERAFQSCIAHFPGRWLTRVMPENSRGLAFWTRVIGNASGGNYNVRLEPEGDKAMHFFRYEIAP